MKKLFFFLSFVSLSLSKAKAQNISVINYTKVDDIRNSTTTAHVIRTFGYYTLGDGGAAEYLWDANSTEMDDSGMVIRPRRIAPDQPGRYKLYTKGVPLLITQFGAVGDAKTDNTRPIQRAINAARKKLPFGIPFSTGEGNHILVPQGDFHCIGSLDFDFAYGIIIKGVGGATIGMIKPPGSILTFTGGGNGSFIYARGSQAFGAEHLMIRYINKEFTGDLINLSHSPDPNQAGDSKNFSFRDCVISGHHTIRTARSLVNLVGAINGRFYNCQFLLAQHGVMGQYPKTPMFSVAHQFRSCEFNECEISHVLNPNMTWLFDGCTFEGPNIGGGGTKHAIYDDVSQFNGVITNLTVRDCWFGDAGPTTAEWIKFEHSICLGLNIENNTFAGSTIAVKMGTQGGNAVNFKGNTFLEMKEAGVDLRNVICLGVTMIGNAANNNSAKFRCIIGGVPTKNALPNNLLFQSNSFCGEIQ